jgi:hypothetical protein
MWQRATWHECASELEQLSKAFRDAYLQEYISDNRSTERSDNEIEIVRISMQGTQVLRALATAVRSEQDFNFLPRDQSVVGVIKHADATLDDKLRVEKNGGCTSLLEHPDYKPLHLREALNKIVHADLRNASFYVDPMGRGHDLLLYGTKGRDGWFVALSLPELIKAIRALPDAKLTKTA